MKRWASFLSTCGCSYKTYDTSIQCCVKLRHKKNLKFSLFDFRFFLCHSGGSFLSMWHHSLYSLQLAYIQSSTTSSHLLNANFVEFFKTCSPFHWIFTIQICILSFSIFWRLASRYFWCCDCFPIVSMLGGILRLTIRIEQSTLTVLVWYNILHYKYLQKIDLPHGI